MSDVHLNILISFRIDSTTAREIGWKESLLPMPESTPTNWLTKRRNSVMSRNQIAGTFAAHVVSIRQ
jgi:hypothetical protein